MKVDLLQFTEAGGCSAKLPAGLLQDILAKLPVSSDPDILVDISTHDDAGVYRIAPDNAIVFTTDFFPPVCSDPYEFGQIAAANSISDIYAMGAKPLLALNIMMFPSGKLPMDAYADILLGGNNKALEAGIHIIGGHTIDDPIPKYGLAVIGFVHPDRIVTNAGVEEGDLLILTKPIGTGIIMAGHRLGICGDKELNAAYEAMKHLNAAGAEVMKKYNVKGATDVTGFGLGGHALKMARASGVTITIQSSKIPLLESTYSLAADGCLPGASFRNLEYCSPDLSVSKECDYNSRMIIFDAQTSGGLLIAVKPDKADEMIGDLKKAGYSEATIIGSAKKRSGHLLEIE